MARSLTNEQLDELRQGNGSFGSAIEALKIGFKIARTGWSENKKPPIVSQYVIPDFEGKTFYDQEQNICFIKTSKGNIACISGIDSHILQIREDWVEDEKEGLFYTEYSDFGKKTITLHSLVFGDVPEGLMIDHISGKRLDNRRENLRIATSKENNANSKSRKNTTSKFKGVSFDSSRSKWISSIQLKGKTKHIGRFDSEEECAKAYDLEAWKEYGEYARLNFPNEYLPLRQFLFLVSGSKFQVNRPPLNKIYKEGTEIEYRPHIDLKSIDGTVGVWNPTMTDILAEDWVVIEEPVKEE